MKRWERLYHPLRIPRPERLRRWQLLTGYHQAEVVSDGIVALVRYRIAVPFAGAAGRRIAFVSDQHYRGNRKDRRLATAVEKILREISPDYLLLGGDVSSHGNQLINEPEIITRGFIYVKENEEMLKELSQVAMGAVGTIKNGKDLAEARSAVKSAVSNYLFKSTRRSPMIIPVINRV